MTAKDRTIYVLKYLWENIDEEHPATVSDIITALSKDGIKVERHALMSNIEKLIEFGIRIYISFRAVKRILKNAENFFSDGRKLNDIS